MQHFINKMVMVLLTINYVDWMLTLVLLALLVLSVAADCATLPLLTSPVSMPLVDGTTFTKLTINVDAALVSLFLHTNCMYTPHPTHYPP